MDTNTHAAALSPSTADAGTIERRVLLGMAGLGGVAVLASMAKGGPLTPPAGAVASSGKTLTEVEPRMAVNAVNTPGSATAVHVISQPGSYYLSGNVAGVSGKSGIEINAHGVTLDLNGFRVDGGGAASGSLDGVRMTLAQAQGITVMNGSVSNWGQTGVSLRSPGTALTYRVEGVHATNNGARGINGGYNGVIRACTARLNGSDGIAAGDPCVIEACATVFNGGAGIHCDFGDALVRGCVCEVNTGAGIQVTDNSLVIENYGRNNTGGGIKVLLAGSRIEGNHFQGTRGIYVTSAGNVIVRNSAGNGSPAYDIVASNRYGPIVALGGATAAVSGGTAASTLTTTDPWANFAY